MNIDEKVRKLYEDMGHSELLKEAFNMECSPHILEEQATMGTIGILKIAVYDNEGPIPHIHVYNNSVNFHTCIRLDKAEYFKHGSRKDTLTRRDKKELIKWFNELHPKFDCNNWDFCVAQWDRSTQYPMDENIVMPDYNLL